MKRPEYIIASVLSLLAICSCSGNRYGENVFRPQIVVEGSIDSGEPAVVVLTQMLPYGSDTEEGPLNMKEIVIRWATVSLSDGERSEMLVGKIDTNYTPPYIYAGSSIRGEPGKKYTLTVKYSGRTLTAETEIPEPVPIRKYEVIPSQTNDTLYSIKIYFEDNPERKDYYKVFAKVKNSDNRYFPAFMGNLSDELLDGEAFMTVNRGLRHTMIDKYSPLFGPDDTVYVKFAHIPAEGFEFWNSYDNEVTNGNNILFPNTSNLKSNISGGRGIWCGYGTDIMRIIIGEENRDGK